MKKENALHGALITRSGYIAAMSSRTRHRKTALLTLTLSLGLAGCASVDQFASSPADKKLIAIAEKAGTDAIDQLAFVGGTRASHALEAAALGLDKAAASVHKEPHSGNRCS